MTITHDFRLYLSFLFKFFLVFWNFFLLTHYISRHEHGIHCTAGIFNCSIMFCVWEFVAGIAVGIEDGISLTFFHFYGNTFYKSYCDIICSIFFSFCKLYQFVICIPSLSSLLFFIIPDVWSPFSSLYAPSCNISFIFSLP